MVTYYLVKKNNTTQLLNIFEFAKSLATRVMRAMRVSVVYMPMCPRAKLAKACQLLISTCQRINKYAKIRRADFSTWRINVPNGNFSTSPAKKSANFLTIF